MEFTCTINESRELGIVMYDVEFTDGQKMKYGTLDGLIAGHFKLPMKVRITVENLRGVGEYIE